MEQVAVAQPAPAARRQGSDILARCTKPLFPLLPHARESSRRAEEGGGQGITVMASATRLDVRV